MKRVYLDYAATTPVDSRVIRVMLPYFSKKFGNTMSLHNFGQEVQEAIDNARKTIADFIHAQPEEIIFTSSATESNNLALKGLAFANKHKNKNHIIISRIEHDCVLESSRWLKSQGFEVTEVSVDKQGFINLPELKKAIKENTLVVSIIHGNNEIGTIQNIKEIGKICKEKNVYFHTDASQTLGQVRINVKDANISLLTGSSHKIYGPKGVALLYIKKGTLIEPILHGGGHEWGKRSSTTNVAGIVGFAKAIEILDKEMEEEGKRLSVLRDKLIKGILSTIPNTFLNGSIGEKRLPNNVNISFGSVEGESLTMELDFNGIAVSTGSACSSKNLMPSHVLMAIGLAHHQAHGSLRFSLGRFTSVKDIDQTIVVLKEAVKKLRKMSPIV